MASAGTAAFDIIFAGGGTSACVVAGRLATIDPSLKILVIEGGQHTRDVPQHIQPSRYVEHLDPKKGTLLYYFGKPTAQLNGRGAVVSCGRAVGGGSTVNFMVYVRGAASDYDAWAAAGNEGWSFRELLPFIRKLETFAIADRTDTHGYSGPIKASAYGGKVDIGNQYLDVAKKYDPARPQVDDNNDFVTADAYSAAYRYVDPVTGKRSDAASTYLYPHADSPNVTILTGTLVKRVIIENGRAAGVEYVADPLSSPGTSGEVTTVKANKLVVISAGALGSPGILERSGIGAPSVLEKNDVPVLVDLPGVGENYHDHIGLATPYYASEETETMCHVWRHPEGLSSRQEQWEKSGAGQIAHTGIEALVKLRPTEAQLASASPELQERWKTFFEPHPDKPMAIVLPTSGCLSDGAERKLFSALYYIMYPQMKGSIHITSGVDVRSTPDLYPDFLSTDSDVEQMVLVYKMTREIVRRMPAYRGELASRHPKFPAGSPAACKETNDPVPIDAPDIVYSKADEDAIANFHRDKANATWHALGTCAMKPRDRGGVVDARLNVYGVEGLKVADLSICPFNVGNNTYSTALLVGEKAASIIAEDLGYAAATRA